MLNNVYELCYSLKLLSYLYYIKYFYFISLNLFFPIRQHALYLINKILILVTFIT